MLDAERLRQIAINVFERFPYQIDGEPRPYMTLAGVNREYRLFRFKLVNDGNTTQFIAEQMLMGALEGFFDQFDVEGSGAEARVDLIVWRTRFTIDVNTLRYETSMGPESTEVYTLRMRCFALPVILALPDHARPEVQVMSSNSGINSGVEMRGEVAQPQRPLGYRQRGGDAAGNASAREENGMASVGREARPQGEVPLGTTTIAGSVGARGGGGGASGPTTTDSTGRVSTTENGERERPLGGRLRGDSNESLGAQALRESEERRAAGPLIVPRSLSSGDAIGDQNPLGAVYRRRGVELLRGEHAFDVGGDAEDVRADQPVRRS